MPTADDDAVLPFSLPGIGRKKVTAAFDGGRISSDGGVILLAGADKRLGLIDALAAIIPDHRDPLRITHGTVNLWSLKWGRPRWVERWPSTGMITPPSPRR
jgi:hypothetical protein